MPARRPLRARLARGVRSLRAARGWSQEEAAHRADMFPRHYQKVEEGTVNLTLATLERLSAAFGVDVAALFEA